MLKAFVGEMGSRLWKELPSCGRPPADPAIIGDDGWLVRGST